MSSNILLVLSGPSGAGKSTLVKMVLDEYNDFIYSVSATTRAPRNGETEGKEYFFVSEETFKEMIENDGLIEWARVYDTDYYGTPRKFIKQNLKTVSIIIDADVQGGIQIMNKFPDAVSVFVKTEDIATLEERIRKRGDVSEDNLKKRLNTALEEMKSIPIYKHVITNTTLDEAFKDLKHIIDSHRKSS